MSDPGGSDEKKPWMSGGPSMYRHPAERLPTDLFSYTREAGHCLRERRFLACIAMASTAVEIILNRDRRFRALPKFKASDGWAYLNNRNLRIARENGLPTDALLSPGDDLNSSKPIAFVEFRNRIRRNRQRPPSNGLIKRARNILPILRFGETRVRLITSVYQALRRADRLTESGS